MIRISWKEDGEWVYKQVSVVAIKDELSGKEIQVTQRLVNEIDELLEIKDALYRLLDRRYEIR